MVKKFKNDLRSRISNDIKIIIYSTAIFTEVGKQVISLLVEIKRIKKKRFERNTSVFQIKTFL